MAAGQADPDATHSNQADEDELVMNLVELALSRPEHERDACIANACRGNTSLIETVRRYVQWEERMQGFLLDPLFPSAELEEPFEPGEQIEGRFRIIREVARGGMGIVYEAADERLERRIAIKCARPGFRKRLPPEVRNATTISHPNVCRIFEIHTAATRRGEIDFITMEFLDGETLAERLRRGAFTEQDARGIALQLCAGLAEAHRNHVIHGDLKTNNVILTGRASGSARAVITDFGLAARQQASIGSFPSGPMGGTPDYMAPELWKGEKASIASDIYALGVLLFELASGRRPYGQDVSWEKRLTAKPARVNPRWDPVLARCLDPDPVRRFASAEGVALALNPPRSRRWLLAAAGVTLAVGSAAVTYQRARAPRETVRLAVLPLQPGAGAAAIAGNLTNDAAAAISRIHGNERTRFSTISQANVVRSRAGSMEKIRAALHATHALHGTLEENQGTLVLHVFLTDTNSNADVTDWEAAYKPAELRYVPEALAGVVTNALHLPPIAVAAMNEAARNDYKNGVMLIQKNSGVDEALLLLERATAADPESPLTRARLAEAAWLKYSMTKDRTWLDRATESAREAEERNPDLAPVHYVEGLLEGNAGRYEQAAADYKRAIELDASYGDAYRHLGKIYEFNNQLDEALRVYKKAAEVQPDYFKPYQELGAFYYYRSDYADAVPTLEKAVRLAPDLAEVHFALASAYREAGRFAEAEKEFQISIALRDTSDAEHSLGYTLMYEAKDQQAIVCYQRALRLGPETALLWLNLGISYARTGSGGRAKDAFRHVLVLDENEILQHPRDGVTRSELAYLYARLGDRQRAGSEAAQALRLTPSDGDVLINVAQTFEFLGERASTLTSLESAPSFLLVRLSRNPELAGLQRDPAFIQLMASKSRKSP
jgi:serine/threonine-protein kinase